MLVLLPKHTVKNMVGRQVTVGSWVHTPKNLIAGKVRVAMTRYQSWRKPETGEAGAFPPGLKSVSKGAQETLRRSLQLMQSLYMGGPLKCN